MKSSIFVGLCVSILLAGPFDIEGTASEIIIADWFVPVGLRASGMAGAHIALAQDYSAAYYNPARLSYVYANEITGAISISSGKTTGTYNGSSSAENFTSTKLALLGGAGTIPAKSGGAGFAIGYTRFQSFDFSISIKGTKSNGTSINAIQQEDGGLGATQIGAGVQIARGVSLGATLDILRGADNYSWRARLSDFTDTLVKDSILADDIADELEGISGRFGVNIAPTNYFSWGLLVKFPSAVEMKEDGILRTQVTYQNGTDSIFEDIYPQTKIELTLPFSFGTGFAITTPYMNFAGDIYYTDWRQIRYTSPAWATTDNAYMSDSYRATLCWAIGAELTLPKLGVPIRLRGGFRSDPLPYKIAITNNERYTATAGAGILIGKSMLIETSFALSNWKRTFSLSGNDFSEEYNINSILLGMSYRF